MRCPSITPILEQYACIIYVYCADTKKVYQKEIDKLCRAHFFVIPIVLKLSYFREYSYIYIWNNIYDQIADGFCDTSTFSKIL